MIIGDEWNKALDAVIRWFPDVEPRADEFRPETVTQRNRSKSDVVGEIWVLFYMWWWDVHDWNMVCPDSPAEQREMARPYAGLSNDLHAIGERHADNFLEVEIFEVVDSMEYLRHYVAALDLPTVRLFAEWQKEWRAPSRAVRWSAPDHPRDR